VNDDLTAEQAQRIAEDLIARTEQAVEQLCHLAVDTGVTFKVADIVDAVERGLPAGYPKPEGDDGADERRIVIEQMAQDFLSGAMYEHQA
jgi:hypothetical protein